jgi:hypothetical protein
MAWRRHSRWWPSLETDGPVARRRHEPGSAAERPSLKVRWLLPGLSTSNNCSRWVWWAWVVQVTSHSAGACTN